VPSLAERAGEEILGRLAEGGPSRRFSAISSPKCFKEKDYTLQLFGEEEEVVVFKPPPSKKKTRDGEREK